MTDPQLTSYSMMKSWNIPPEIKNKTRIPILATFIEHNFGSPSTKIIRRRKKRNPKEEVKEEVKLLLFADYDMILLHIEDSIHTRPH